MKEPTPHGSRLAIAAGLAAAILVGGGGFLLGQATTERPPVAAAPASVVALPAQPTTEPPPERGVLGRADLVALAAAAADAAAAGGAPGSALADAAGRRFELRLPFGCDGPAAANSNAAMRWRYDAEDSALRLHVAPTVWTAADWWRGATAPAVASIEGFWVQRPWTSDEGCPTGADGPAATGAEPVTLPGQTLALGQVFSEDGARPGRRDRRAYETVVRVAEDALDTSRGFRLRISGRIARLPGTGAARCHQPSGAEQRPICLVGVSIDEVAIDNPASGETLATWNIDQGDAPNSRPTSLGR